MPEVTYVLADGERRTLDVPEGTSLMIGAVSHRLDGIVGECGGQMMCATCHVYVEPQFLGRVQPYSVCLPATYAPGRKLPLTLLLHSLALGQNQFAAIDPRLLHQVCDGRDSVVVTPLARGPSCWYFDEGELDVWEVWARVAEQLGTDPNRTVVSGYSMGGYGAYKLGLTYPEVFAQAVVLAGPPTCGVRLLPDVDIPGDLDQNSHCAREGDTWRLLVNARWLPFVIAHGVLDGLVPIASVLQQVLEIDAEPVLTLVMVLVAVLTLVSVGLYLAEWVRHMNSAETGR